MLRRTVIVNVIVIGLLMALGAPLAVAAPAPPSGAPSSSKSGSKSGSKPGVAKAAKRPTSHARHASAKTRQAPAKSDSAARVAGAPRRLEDIHIEGEIPAPQVLFVTARDQRRFTRFHHQRYLKTSVQVGETTQLPTRIALTSHPPAPAGAP